ncbi:MAG TPA: biliverdin-producing heme oxygenase [Kofleriaceae bacterium]|jgi:heme oxygenase|nr:biliverdin-producing heme oxygenase [Kofleriaceae bacterium]
MRRLDDETRDLHADVDAYWLDLMASGVTKSSYRAQLVRVYGFEAPFESALAYTPKLIIQDRRDRTRSGLIAQDLLALGVSPARITSLPQCDRIGPFDDPAEALGWKYVTERPTQIHSAIKRNVVARVNDSANALAYLSAYDGIAPARWHQLGVLLDSVATRPGAQDKMIEAAKTAFQCMATWFRTPIED